MRIRITNPRMTPLSGHEEVLSVDHAVRRAMADNHNLIPALIVKLVEKGILRAHDLDDILPTNYAVEE